METQNNILDKNWKSLIKPDKLSSTVTSNPVSKTLLMTQVTTFPIFTFSFT